MNQPYMLQGYQIAALNVHPHFEGMTEADRLATAHHFLNEDKSDPYIHQEGGSTLSPLAWAMLDVLYPPDELLALVDQNVNI